MTTRTLTRAEYNAKRPRFAGTIAHEDQAEHNVWRQLYPDWDGKHWAIGEDERGGTYLAPINIRD